MKPIRVLIVDDSAVMRGLIARVLARDPELLVVGEAGDPYQARQAIKELNPDVMTLDVEMPRMTGVEFLEKVMRLRPFPVVMVSTLTEQGAAITIRALELGAVDYISKPTPEHPDTLEELPAKLKAAASVKEFADSRPVGIVAGASEASYRWDGKIVAIGASTGGVEALISVLSSYPKACPPTVIAIHMPAQFTKSFAQRLDRLIAPEVVEAVDGAALEPGRVYIAPGSVSHLEVVKLDKLRCRLTNSAPVNGHRPSVDPLFHSVSGSCGPNALGVILTGMGRDGADGLLAMRRAGARTIGQNQATCVVYGMPRVAFEIGAVEIQSALGDIGADILALTSGIRGRK